MSIIENIERRYRIEVLGMYPVMCKRTKAGYREDKLILGVREEIHVAYLYEYPGTHVKGLAVGFYPGVTGHESFMLKSAGEQLTKFASSYVPLKTAFGYSRWEHQPWSLNAGSSTYDGLTCTYGDIQDIIEYFESILKSKG